MNDSKWARYAAIGGVAFVVLNIVGATLSGSPPSGNDSATKIAKYYVDKGDGLKAALWLGGLASVGLVWWFGSLWRRMSRAEGGAHRLSVVSLIGLGLGGALFLASAAVNAAIALRASDVGEGARVFYTLSLVLLAGSGFGLAIHLLATNALALRSMMLPTWPGWHFCSQACLDRRRTTHQGSWPGSSASSASPCGSLGSARCCGATRRSRRTAESRRPRTFASAPPRPPKDA